MLNLRGHQYPSQTNEPASPAADVSAIEYAAVGQDHTAFTTLILDILDETDIFPMTSFQDNTGSSQVGHSEV